MNKIPPALFFLLSCTSLLLAYSFCDIPLHILPGHPLPYLLAALLLAVQGIHSLRGGHLDSPRTTPRILLVFALLLASLDGIYLLIEKNPRLLESITTFRESRRAEAVQEEVDSLYDNIVESLREIESAQELQLSDTVDDYFIVCERALRRFEERTGLRSGGIEILESPTTPLAWAGWIPTEGHAAADCGSGETICWQIEQTPVFQYLATTAVVEGDRGEKLLARFYYPLSLLSFYRDTFPYEETFSDMMSRLLVGEIRLTWQSTSGAGDGDNAPRPEGNDIRIDPQSGTLSEMREKLHLAFLSLLVLILMLRFIRRSREEIPEKSKEFLLRHLCLILLLIAVRTVLLHLRFPWFFIGNAEIADPSIYTTGFLFGFFRSPGDLFLSACFILTYILLLYREPEASPTTPRPGSTIGSLVRFLPLLLLVYVQHRITGDIASSAINNPFLQFPGFSSLPMLFLGLSIVILAACGIAASRLWLLHVQSGTPRASTGARRFPLPPSLYSPAFLLACGYVLCAACANERLIWPALVTSLVIVIWSTLVRSRDMAVITGILLVALSCTVEYGIERSQVLRTTIEEESADALAHPRIWLQFFISSILENLSTDEELLDALETPSSESLKRKAFALWAKTDLKYVGSPSSLKIMDRYSNVADIFSVAMPVDMKEENTHHYHSYFKDRSFRLFEIQDEERGKNLTILSGMMPLARKGHFLGSLILSIPLRHGLPILTDTDQWLMGEGRGDQHLLIDPLPFQEITVEPTVSPGLEPSSEHGVQRSDGNWTTEGGSERKYLLETSLAGKPEYFTISFNNVQFTLHNFFNCLIIATVALVIFFIAFTLSSLPRSGGIPSLLQRKNWTFQYKILGLLLTISILVMIFWGFFSTGITRSEMAKSYQLENRRNSLIVKHSMESRLEKEARELAEHPAIHDLIIEGSNPAVDFLEESGKNLLVCDTGAEVLARTGDFPAPDRDAIRQTIESSYTSTFYLRSGRELFMIALLPVKVRPSARMNLGALAVAQRITTDRCQSLAGDLQIDFSIYAGSDIHVSSRMELYESEFLPSRIDGDVYRMFYLANRESFEEHENAGQSLYRATFLPLRDRKGECTGVLSVPSLHQGTEIQLRIQKILSFVAGFVVLWFALIVTAGKSLSEKISSPLLSLIRATRVVADGKLGYHVTTRATDELQVLVESFNAMSRNLKSYSDNLNRQKTLLGTIVKNITSGVLALSADGRIVSLNPRACTLLGISESWLDRSIEEGEEIEGLRIISRRQSRARLSPATVEFEITPDVEGRESIIKVAMTAIPGETSPGMPAIIVVLEDITELVGSKKLIAWGEMARQVAHEVKNPLTPMKLSAQYMKRAYQVNKPNFPEIFTRSIDVIITQIGHLDRLVRDFSLITGKSLPPPGALDIAQILEDICLMYEGLSLRGIEIVREIDDRLQRVCGVEEEMRKILLNIMENAQQAIHGDGTITVVARNERRDAPGPAEVVITIEDDGEGISDRNRGKIFEPEFSTKSYGTGLGLFITRNLVEKIGGSIAISSTPGKGTAVTLRLPTSGE